MADVAEVSEAGRRKTRGRARRFEVKREAERPAAHSKVGGLLTTAGVPVLLLLFNLYPVIAFYLSAFHLMESQFSLLLLALG